MAVVNDSDNDESRGYSTELVPRRSTTPAVHSTGPVRTATGVVWVALSAVTEATAWGLGTALGVTSTVVRGSMAGRPTREVLSEAGEQVRDSVRRALGIPPGSEAPNATANIPGLRDRGAELLRRSADVHAGDDDHPAFARILAELAPDEARILRHLYLDGPQPALDVRTGRALNPGAPRTAMGLNMIGEDAALRFPDRADSYLTNLRRLGLAEWTREPLDNPTRYQLLESQPEVRKLLKRSGFGTKVFYRGIALTGFGADFVRTCLPVPPLDQAL
ncbi:Abi-alpha family protein [Nocardia sp. NPDC051570]|uniref:Abi-alpha family protein n=1 Tax=Nocardia sp. NPDC051570 TaxID=3364324 RepID=UPI003788EF05